MKTLLADTWYVAMRHLRHFARQPWWIAINLVQPVVWLGLYGALFKRIIDLRGFWAESYVAFLTPGIVVMSALSSSGWTGMGVIDDLNSGVMDRFLVSPVRRGALIAGPLVQTACLIVLQSLIIVAVGLALGARYRGGVTGVLVLLAAVVLLSWTVGALSIGLGLTARQRETLIAVVNFSVLPLTFLSSVLIQPSLAPTWVQQVAAYNPVTWATEAARAAFGTSPDWVLVRSRVTLLALLALLAGLVATRAFRAYQRSV